ncbi:OVARIAN TUMOR DOMAIN-containing deubiquitinating enzyme 2 [Citrus sinensis]|uniref:OVARIAN TUMOR DOMAIN-containing deubiquitinating enzyme 2 n=1 Tax=Citrus sinensis TaxID=2711 RepID=A0ACB8P1L4_CITSI|nr:OVARIAN TUMOR DOMAIN-containing deubiquitinating enzyme 2 [Citrus sinensis]
MLIKLVGRSGMEFSWPFDCVLSSENVPYELIVDGIHLYGNLVELSAVHLPPVYSQTSHSSTLCVGAIELSILADYYGREIAAYDIQTTRCDLYGQISPFEGAPEEFEQTIFPVQKGRTIGPAEDLALKLVKEQQRKKTYTDTANFTLCCGVCQIGVIGQKAIAATVASDTVKHSEAFIGKSNQDYCSWIQDPEKWGGAIELSILADYYGSEIAAYDIQTTRCDLYGQISAFEGAPVEFDQSSVPVRKDRTIGPTEELAFETC